MPANRILQPRAAVSSAADVDHVPRGQLDTPVGFTSGGAALTRGKRRASTRRGHAQPFAGSETHAGTTAASDGVLTRFADRDTVATSTQIDSPETGVERSGNTPLRNQIGACIGIVLMLLTATGWPFKWLLLLAEAIR